MWHGNAMRFAGPYMALILDKVCQTGGLRTVFGHIFRQMRLAVLFYNHLQLLLTKN